MVNAVPDPIIFPTTFNDEFIVVALFNLVFPETFNDELIVVALFNVVLPETFTDELTFVILFNVVFPETFNDELTVVILFNVVLFPDIFKVDSNVEVLFKLTNVGGFNIAIYFKFVCIRSPMIQIST